MKPGKILLRLLLALSLPLSASRAAGPGRKAAPPAPPVLEPSGSAADLQDSFARVAQAVKPAVVSVTSVHVESVQVVSPEFFFGDPFQDFLDEFQGRPRRERAPQQPPRTLQRRSEGLGSGVVIDPRGYVLTNEHVVRGAQTLTVTFQSPEERKYSAKVVGADPRTDLAVIKIEGKGDFPSAALGNSDRVRVGDWAIAIGSPFGLEQTLTVGVVSAVRQSLSIEGAQFADMLQTDAAINRGNSGGPLLNLKGEVIGINSAIYAPTGVFAGVGFAIPANRARDIMAQLIEKGRVVRGWMGVEVMPLDEVLAGRFGVKDGKGVLVNGVMPGSPADAAGLKRGDVIIEFNGRKISDQASLLDAVGRTPPKTKAPVKAVRDAKVLDLTLVTGEAPADPDAAPKDEKAGVPSAPAPRDEEWEGARLAKASPALAQRYGFPPAAAGVVILSAAPGGLAEEAGLLEGDLVTSVDGAKTPDPSAFTGAVKKADLKRGVVFDIFRRGRWTYLTYRQPQ